MNDKLEAFKKATKSNGFDGSLGTHGSDKGDRIHRELLFTILRRSKCTVKASPEFLQCNSSGDFLIPNLVQLNDCFQFEEQESSAE
jgi:hypothetical protein